MITKTKPFAHQSEDATRFRFADYFALLHEQGLGKSKTTLDALCNDRRVKGALVLGPNGLHANWHFKEAPEHCPIPYDAYYWNGTPGSLNAKRELQAFLEAVPENEQKGRFSFMFMNVEAIRTKTGFGAAEAFLKAVAAVGAAAMVVDESTCIKNPKAQVTKAAFKLADLADKRAILTGTPLTQGPLDFYSQIKFLHPKAIPFRTWTSFKAAFAVEEVQFAGNRQFRKVVDYKNLGRLAELVRPFASRRRKEDCLDLPEKVWQQRHVPMTLEQEKAYRELRDQALTELQCGSVVSSTLPLTTIMKLQQIVSGFVKTDEGEVTPLRNHRIAALLEIAEATRPLVVFCAFRENVEQVAKALESVNPDKEGDVVRYMGGMGQAERTEAIRRFQDGRSDFIVCTSAGAMGITLTRSSYMVYYSNTYSLQTRLQSQDRIHRIGQRNFCTYVDLVTPGTTDQRVLEILLAKKDICDLVLDQIIDIIK